MSYWGRVLIGCSIARFIGMLGRIFGTIPHGRKSQIALKEILGMKFLATIATVTQRTQRRGIGGLSVYC
ncbi:hypothetical protein SAMN05421761_103370 [Belliella pelovolcani]|uniref:Uncharacterized protein n=1 Tax=Belliella pelovolcani TaxID=529505 RepID=A0A1N7LIX0_9BACT|nr:hypothetical protein SAMN05421761_103370 [Belliella pelovolcani]